MLDLVASPVDYHLHGAVVVEALVNVEAIWFELQIHVYLRAGDDPLVTGSYA